MKTKHTPGPWAIADGVTHSPWTALRIRPGQFANHSIPPIATIPKGDFYSDYIANAELIAAAPDILEALIRAERKLSAYIGVCEGDKELAFSVLPMVRSAIFKATGGAA